MIIEAIVEIKSELEKERNSKRKIAFVPTMGALHEGHLALIKKAKELADIVVVSIFVNKAQFNNSQDYEKYPRQTQLDLKKLEPFNVDYIFLPSEEEMKKVDYIEKIIPDNLKNCLCGSSRIGHFEGMVMIVSKFFDIINPHIAIFGQKDFQQLAIIKNLVKESNLNIEIFPYKIVREKSKLAMSSRNQRLSDDGKIKAANIYRILEEIKNDIANGEKNFDLLCQKKKKEFLDLGFDLVDYLEIREEESLKLITNYEDQKKLRIFAAVYLEQVRLIDNLVV